ncbi:hypothetical protein BHE74_00037447 [Ensete ventricosum]|nr:hypothetical protein BHE74_00037447 [Ensete ventricosum]
MTWTHEKRGDGRRRRGQRLSASKTRERSSSSWHVTCPYRTAKSSLRHSMGQQPKDHRDPPSSTLIDPHSWVRIPPILPPLLTLPCITLALPVLCLPLPRTPPLWHAMKPNLSSLTSTFPPPNSFPGAPYFSLKRHAVAPRRAPRVHICGSCSGRPSESPRIGDPEPPWLLHPPGAAPKHTSSGDAPLVGFRIKGSAVGIPFSLRLVQMKKKRMNSRLARAPPDTDVGDFGSAVWSLAFAMEEIQRSVLSSDYDGETRAGAPKDAADSVVWLFQNVFCTSPDLVVRLLVLLSEFLAASSKREMPDAIVFDEVEAAAYRCWFDVGILDEDEEATRYDGSRPDYKRRRAAYENMIASGLTTSLILSNYAQLLYQYEEDLDR